MGETLPERQKWLEHALQGLAFWIGHRHSLFNAYPLTEGALVAEACNLMQANLPSGLILLPECMYRNLVPLGTQIDGVTGQSRADLVICDDDAKPVGRDGNVAPHVRFVIEVKRASATDREINTDLVRLHSYQRASNNNARTFLFVVSESRAHPRFVKDGKSILGVHDIPNCGGHFRVRRTVKAAASFSGKETAHYVCLIEVFRHSHDRARPI
ncbi:hypothetical protein [Nitratireductor sp. XY-223]|uniref:hypothetical protein n=1 Tax=Nitratireductor sp. XY-223 TaxID=2561926 RepID=UPI0010AAC225|nr:hypothetical protein [Nitratireductor sp. XY-223]